jgi:hypothetical protein
LSLIVLFALIAVMLYESQSQTYAVEGLTDAEKALLVKEPGNHVTGVLPLVCPTAEAIAAGAARPPTAAHCVAGEARYTVHLQRSPAPESTDLAKQLLILIGTLMTSVTSFYFASRATETAARTALAAMKPDPDPDPKTPPVDPADPGPKAADAGVQAAASEDHLDGCNVPIANATADADLPPATGGVAS